MQFCAAGLSPQPRAAAWSAAYNVAPHPAFEALSVDKQGFRSGLDQFFAFTASWKRSRSRLDPSTHVGKRAMPAAPNCRDRKRRT